MMHLRFAEPKDSAVLLDIYNVYINTPITFETVPPSEEEFARRIRDFSSFYPYLLWEENGKIGGYAYAHQLWSRAAYQWNAELSVYLHPDFTGRGIGRRLYSALLELLRLQGILTAYGIVTLPNAASEGLHRSLGFETSAVYSAAGYKCDTWLDVAWFRKDLAAHAFSPAAPCPIHALSPAVVHNVLRSAEN